MRTRSRRTIYLRQFATLSSLGEIKRAGAKQLVDEQLTGEKITDEAPVFGATSLLSDDTREYIVYHTLADREEMDELRQPL